MIIPQITLESGWCDYGYLTCQSAESDLLTISLAVTSLALDEDLRDATHSGLDFSATSLWYCQINQTHPKPGDLGTKLILYFSWCSFQTFYKKLTCLSRAAHVGEGGWENREEAFSNRRFPTQFLVKLCSIELSWECGDKYTSQLVCKWAGIFKSRIC